MDVRATWFVGVDIHKYQHTAVAIDAFHQPQLAVRVPNNPVHFDAFLQSLLEQIPDGVTLLFGLEDTQSLGRSLAQWLLRKGFTVMEVNPVFTNREQNRTSDPDRSDVKDAQAIAEALYRHRSHLPKVYPDARYKALRQVVHARENLVAHRTRLKNQIHALLHEQYPDYRTFFADPFGKTGHAYFSRFPSPKHLKGIGVRRLTAFLRRQTKNLGEKRARHILAHINKTAHRDRSTDARDALIPMLYEQLELIAEQVERVDEQLTELIQDSPYQLRTMVGMGNVLAATIEAEVGDVERLQRGANSLARLGGMAPVERSSGVRERHVRRKYGRPRLRQAFYQLAMTQISRAGDGRATCPEARAYYERKVAEGKSRKAALRCLMRRLVDIVYAMMRDRTPYRRPAKPLPPIKEVVPS